MTRFTRLITPFLAVSLATLALNCNPGDPGPTKPLLAPNPDAQAAATEFRNQFPGARVAFSQSTGELLLIDGNGQALARGSSADVDGAFAVVTSFMNRYPGLYRIAQPEVTLRPAAEGFRTGAAARGGLRTLRFEETKNGIAIRGKFGIAVLGAGGELLSLTTRLVPSDQVQLASGSGTGTTAQPLTVAPTYDPRRPGHLAVLRRTSVLETLDGQTYERMEERVERRNMTITRTLIDGSGQVLTTHEAAPSSLVAPDDGWQTQGASVTRAAHDARGQLRQIPSTVGPQGTLILGFTLPGILTGGAAATIADARTAPNPGLVPEVPLASTAAAWTDEPAYESDLRDATGLAVNLEATFRWYQDRLGWTSWDGKGSPFYAAIRGHRATDPAPEINAYGTSGYMLIGDGHTPTGQPLSDALDVVGHEFTHSVIDATADFAYQDEPGALNEALADTFGESVAGFQSTVYAQDAGWATRDLLHPEQFGLPRRYSEYEVTTEDHGGVHSNCGIVERALALVIIGEGGGESGGGLGPVPVTRFLLDSLRDVAWSGTNYLEEYAAATAAYCQARGQASSLAADQNGICARLEDAFKETELLRFL